jgi:hypothetical protein
MFVGVRLDCALMATKEKRRKQRMEARKDLISSV